MEGKTLYIDLEKNPQITYFVAGQYGFLIGKPSVPFINNRAKIELRICYGQGCLICVEDYSNTFYIDEPPQLVCKEPREGVWRDAKGQQVGRVVKRMSKRFVVFTEKELEDLRKKIDKIVDEMRESYFINVEEGTQRIAELVLNFVESHLADEPPGGAKEIARLYDFGGVIYGIVSRVNTKFIFIY